MHRFINASRISYKAQKVARVHKLKKQMIIRTDEQAHRVRELAIEQRLIAQNVTLYP
jgi:hypothetical protein